MVGNNGEKTPTQKKGLRMIVYFRVKKYPNYRVGTDGSLWSKAFGKWRKLKLTPQSSGHLYVTLYRNNKGKAHYVHRLVLEAVVGPCPPGMEARHFPDRDPSNNNANNISWA